MSDVEADSDITVGTLQTRLSELQTLWQTTKRRTSSTVRDNEGEENAEDAPLPTRAAAAAAPVVAVMPMSFQPTKPATPPIRSPRPHHHPRTLSVEGAAVMGASATGSRESTTSMGLLALTPHSPPTPSTGTPRTRLKASRQPSHSPSPERVSTESLTLPPIQAHALSSLTCPQCCAKAASATSRFCSQCGHQLAGC